MEKPGAGGAVREIKRRTRMKYSSEEKIRIVLEVSLVRSLSGPELQREPSDREAVS
jgi:hypothetical protein